MPGIEIAAEYAALYIRVAGVTVPIEVARPLPAIAGHGGLDIGRSQARPRVRPAAEKTLEVAAA